LQLFLGSWARGRYQPHVCAWTWPWFLCNAKLPFPTVLLCSTVPEFFAVGHCSHSIA